jgi:hypothetical protein
VPFHRSQDVVTAVFHGVGFDVRVEGVGGTDLSGKHGGLCRRQLASIDAEIDM